MLAFSNFTVVLKQENRDEMDLSSVPSLALTHCTDIKGHSSLQTQLPSSDPGLSHDSLLSTSPRSLVCPIQQTYTPMVSSTVSQLSHIQGRNINPGEEHQVLSSAVVHQPFQVTSASSARPSYQPMQSNVMFNGQSGLPINSASSSQGYNAVSFQQDAAVPPLINLSCQSLPSMPYHSSNPGSVSTSATAGGHSSAHPAQPRQTSPHLQSMGYHCPNPQQPPVSSPMTQSLEHHSTQLQVSYHSSNTGNTSSPSQKSSHSLIHSPRSGSSSPQLQPMPYQTPSSGPASSPTTTVSHSGQQPPQAHSPGLGGITAVSSLMQHNLCDTSPFSSEGAAANIKPEPEDPELSFQTMGLQDITLDDGK